MFFTYYSAISTSILTPKSHNLIDASRTVGCGGTLARLMMLRDRRECRMTSFPSTSESESESELTSESFSVAVLDAWWGVSSSKFREPEIERRKECTGWNVTAPIASSSPNVPDADVNTEAQLPKLGLTAVCLECRCWLDYRDAFSGPLMRATSRTKIIYGDVPGLIPGTRVFVYSLTNNHRTLFENLLDHLSPSTVRHGQYRSGFSG